MSNISGVGSFEAVGFGVENDACGNLQANGRVVEHFEHGPESRIALLSGLLLYSRKEQFEAFDASFEDDAGRPILAVATSNFNQPVGFHNHG